MQKPILLAGEAQAVLPTSPAIQAAQPLTSKYPFGPAMSRATWHLTKAGPPRGPTGLQAARRRECYLRATTAHVGSRPPLLLYLLVYGHFRAIQVISRPPKKVCTDQPSQPSGGQRGAEGRKTGPGADSATQALSAGTRLPAICLIPGLRPELRPGDTAPTCRSASAPGRAARRGVVGRAAGRPTRLGPARRRSRGRRSRRSPRGGRCTGSVQYPV